MRRTAIACVSLGLASFALTAPASATVLMSETFTYANGNLVPNGGWSTHSGSGVDIQVSSGKIQGNNLNAPDDNKTFTPQPVTGKTYACFQITIPTPGAPPDSNYIAHFMDATTTNFFARVWVGAAGATLASGFKFGISSTTCACNQNCVPTWWASALNYDQLYTVTISYNGANGVAELWVDAANELSTKITNTATAATGQMQKFAFRQSSSPPTSCPSGNFDWKYTVDNLGVGTTFTDACNGGPTPARQSTWGQLKVIYK